MNEKYTQFSEKTDLKKIVIYNLCSHFLSATNSLLDPQQLHGQSAPLLFQRFRRVFCVFQSKMQMWFCRKKHKHTVKQLTV